MIAKRATMCVDHETIRLAVSEYFGRHYVPGSAPVVFKVEYRTGTGTAAEFIITLDPPVLGAAAPQEHERGVRAYDLVTS